MYVGVRAGGGIGDEIQDPAGDEFEVERIVFDITFFFFVIVILLAIIQGESHVGNIIPACVQTNRCSLQVVSRSMPATHRISFYSNCFRVNRVMNFSCGSEKSAVCLFILQCQVLFT